MQKKLIALAVAGLVSGSAFAQSNVTISGIVDLGYRASSSGNVDTAGIDNGAIGGSRLIFKGEEALGNGMKAVFNLEYGLTPDTNSGVGTSTSRQTYLGLAGGFGTVVAGRLQPMAKGMSDKFDPMASLWFSAEASMVKASGSTINNGIRLSNAAAYVSPTMGGLTAQVAYSFNGVSQLDAVAYPNDSERIVGLSLDYAAGPFGAGFIYHRASDVGAPTAAAGNDFKDMALFGSYDLQMVKLYANYRSVDRMGTPKDKVVSLGISAPVGAGLVYLGYAKLDDGAAASKDANSMGIAYRHNLSKRTAAYVGYQRVSNDNGATASVFGGSGAIVAGQNSSGYGAGVFHTF